METANSFLRDLNICKTCVHYINDQRCATFEVIPEKFWLKMYIKDQANHTVPEQGQIDPLVYQKDIYFKNIE